MVGVIGEPAAVAHDGHEQGDPGEYGDGEDVVRAVAQEFNDEAADTGERCVVRVVRYVLHDVRSASGRRYDNHCMVGGVYYQVGTGDWLSILRWVLRAFGGGLCRSIG